MAILLVSGMALCSSAAADQPAVKPVPLAVLDSAGSTLWVVHPFQAIGADPALAGMMHRRLADRLREPGTTEVHWFKRTHHHPGSVVPAADALPADEAARAIDSYAATGEVAWTATPASPSVFGVVFGCQDAPLDGGYARVGVLVWIWDPVSGAVNRECVVSIYPGSDFAATADRLLARLVTRERTVDAQLLTGPGPYAAFRRSSTLPSALESLARFTLRGPSPHHGDLLFSLDGRDILGQVDRALSTGGLDYFPLIPVQSPWSGGDHLLTFGGVPSDRYYSTGAGIQGIAISGGVGYSRDRRWGVGIRNWFTGSTGQTLEGFVVPDDAGRHRETVSWRRFEAVSNASVLGDSHLLSARHDWAAGGGTWLISGWTAYVREGEQAFGGRTRLWINGIPKTGSRARIGSQVYGGASVSWRRWRRLWPIVGLCALHETESAVDGAPLPGSGVDRMLAFTGVRLWRTISLIGGTSLTKPGRTFVGFGL